jgi:hypothetical protein
MLATTENVWRLSWNGQGSVGGLSWMRFREKVRCVSHRDRVSDQPVGFAELKIFEPQCKSPRPSSGDSQ